VHMTGGVSGLCGAIIVGPRIGRFDEQSKTPIPLPGHSSVLQVLGTFILWLGWCGFNMGSTLSISSVAVATQAGRILMCTSLSGAMGGVLTVCIDRFTSPSRAWDVAAMCNGILSGLVSITAGCATTATWAAVLIGGTGALVYTSASSLVLKAKIDDPLDAFAVHGACGAWGVIASALFSTDTYSKGGKGGLFYGDGDKLGAAVVFILAVSAWSATLSTAVFLLLSRLKMLRDTSHLGGHKVVERLDDSQHAGQAYPRSSGTASAVTAS